LRGRLEAGHALRQQSRGALQENLSGGECGFAGAAAAGGMRRHSAPLLFLALAATALAPSVVGQGPTWASPNATPSGRYRHAAAYDEGRGRMVVFGGSDGAVALNDTWEHDGSTWIRRTPATSPPASTDATMTYDPVRGVTWLATGGGGGADVWKWDGDEWAQAPSLPALPAGNGWRRRVVWHGGTNPGPISWQPYVPLGSPGTTWRFDGSTWISMGTYTYPAGPSLNDGNAVYVPTTGLTYVLDALRIFAWDGSAWHTVAATHIGAPPYPTFSPANRSMTWDASRQRLIVHNAPSEVSIVQLTSPLQSQWTTLINQAPSLRYYTTLVHDKARHTNLLFGGVNAMSPPQVFNELFVMDSTSPAPSWQLMPPLANQPTARLYTDMAFEANTGRMVLGPGQGPFGPQNDTWTYDGSTWTNHGNSATVTPRSQPAICYAPGIGTMLFGGGVYPTTYHNDTWRFLGTQWLNTVVYGAPPPRMGHDMVWASNWNCMVMFGGYNGSTLGDSWSLTTSFPGVQWNQMLVPNTIPPRQSHAMAFDPRRDRLVVFGGADANGQFLGDTWEMAPAAFGWQWIQRTPAQSPPRRWQHKMDYDPARGVVVMTGGYGNPQCGQYCASHLNDVWEYDGDTWTQRVPSTSLPAVREGAGFAYDSQRQRFVMQGGSGSTPFPGETWFYTAGNDRFGEGMQGGSSLRLRCTQFPVAGQTTGFAFDSPYGFGWLSVFVGPAPQAGLTLGPGLLCGTGTIYGLSGIVVDAMGLPGSVSFQLPASMIGQGLVAQGIALDTGMCLRLTDPLAVTIHAP
jgi:hypothetical protein